MAGCKVDQEVDTVIASWDRDTLLSFHSPIPMEKPPLLPPCKVPKIEGALHSTANLSWFLHDVAKSETIHVWQIWDTIDCKSRPNFGNSIQKVMPKTIVFLRFWIMFCGLGYALNHVSVGNDIKVHTPRYIQRFQGKVGDWSLYFPIELCHIFRFH